jgi:NADPH-dependent ferric siderophore reductase
MGESRAMIALRSMIEAAGVGHEDVFVKGYWNLGRPGRAPS